MHARLALDGNGILYGGDCPPDMPYEGIKGVSLTLNYDTVEQAQRVFGALAEGGTVTMAMQPAFWAKAWGMLVDRFGTPWIVNGELIPL
jgi:PhnB protein